MVLHKERAPVLPIPICEIATLFTIHIHVAFAVYSYTSAESSKFEAINIASLLYKAPDSRFKGRTAGALHCKRFAGDVIASWRRVTTVPFL